MPVKIIDGLNKHLFDAVVEAHYGDLPVVLLDAEGNPLIGDLPDAPTISSTIADRVYAVGGNTVTIDAATRFSGATSYSMTPVNLAALPGISWNGRVITIDLTDVISTTPITLRGINAGGISEPLAFTLTVNEAEPTLTEPLPDLNLSLGDDDVVTDLSEHFDGAESYSVSPTGQGVTISGSAMTSSAAAERSATYTVTANNITGQTVSDAFALVVVAESDVRAFAFPAPDAPFDINFAQQQYYGGIQPRDGFDNDGRFFRPLTSQSTPMFSEEADGSLYVQNDTSLRITTRGLLVHPLADRSYVLHNRDLTQAVWTKVGCTVSKDLTGRDKRENSASRLTVQSSGATALQTVSVAGVRRPYLDVKRISGAGSIEMTFNSGETWEALDLSDVRYDGWARCTLPMRSIADGSVVGFRFGSEGDVFGIDLIQLTDLDFDTSPIQVGGNNARKPADRPSVGSVASNTGGTLSGLFEFYSENELWGIYCEFSNRNPGNIYGQIIRHDAGGLISYRTDYGNSGLVSEPGTFRPWPAINKAIGITDGQGGARFCLNGGPILTAASGFGRFTSLDHTDMMANGAGTANGDGIMRRVTFFEAQMSDAEMQAWTVP